MLGSTLFVFQNDNDSMVNLTDWLNKSTNAPATDTLSTFNGFILRRLKDGTGLVVTVTAGLLLRTLLLF